MTRLMQWLFLDRPYLSRDLQLSTDKLPCEPLPFDEDVMKQKPKGTSKVADGLLLKAEETEYVLSLCRFSSFVMAVVWFSMSTRLVIHMIVKGLATALNSQSAM